MTEYLIYELDQNNFDDINYIKDNIGNLFTISWNKVQFLDQINSNNTKTYILKYNTNIIGFIILSICIDEIEILNICIDKNHRNKGLGHYLLENTIKILKENGFNKIFLEVNINNIFAIKLYKKIGFEILSIRKNYYLNKITNTKEDAYVMTKNL